MASLALGRHVRMFVEDDVLSKLKGFSFNKGEVIVRIGSSLHFHREKDLGKFSAQPHTIVKQICFPNGNVLFLLLFSLSKN